MRGSECQLEPRKTRKTKSESSRVKIQKIAKSETLVRGDSQGESGTGLRGDSQNSERGLAVELDLGGRVKHSEDSD